VSTSNLNGHEVRTRPGVAFKGAVATFSADNAGLRFDAFIDWGDGRGSAGQVSANADGSMSVVGQHVYSHRGRYVATVDISGTYDFVTGNKYFGSFFSTTDAIVGT
jgi:hypothetical protein